MRGRRFEWSPGVDSKVAGRVSIQKPITDAKTWTEFKYLFWLYLFVRNTLLYANWSRRDLNDTLDRSLKNGEFQEVRIEGPEIETARGIIFPLDGGLRIELLAGLSGYRETYYHIDISTHQETECRRARNRVIPVGEATLSYSF